MRSWGQLSQCQLEEEGDIEYSDGLYIHCSPSDLPVHIAPVITERVSDTLSTSLMVGTG